MAKKGIYPNLTKYLYQKYMRKERVNYTTIRNGVIIRDKISGIMLDMWDKLIILKAEQSCLHTTLTVC